MNRHVYKEKRTFLKYDDSHIIGYLNEEVVENYVPDMVQVTNDKGEEMKPEPWEQAYAYTGTETDGGTVMPCKDSSDYKEIANAIIRTKYSESDELAIQRHAINGEYDDAPAEYEEYDNWCKNAVKTAKAWVYDK